MKDEDKQNQERKPCEPENSDTCAYCRVPCPNQEEDDGQDTQFQAT